LPDRHQDPEAILLLKIAWGETAVNDIDQEARRRQRVQLHLERILLSHQKLQAAVQRTEPALLEHPLPELAALPATTLFDPPNADPPDVPVFHIDRASADRFASLAIDARAMIDRWEDLADEYEQLASVLRRISDAEDL
jgi:hypothetical protein